MVFDEVLVRVAISKSFSYTETCRNLGISHVGGSYRSLRSFIINNKIDVSHFSPQSRKGKIPHNKRDIESYLNNEYYITSSKLKNRLIKENILENVCVLCGQLPIWNGKPLTLELDHIDGNPINNNLNNLRILCGHCHSQTDTYKSRNKRKVATSGGQTDLKSVASGNAEGSTPLPSSK